MKTLSKLCPGPLKLDKSSDPYRRIFDLFHFDVATQPVAFDISQKLPCAVNTGEERRKGISDGNAMCTQQIRVEYLSELV